MPFRPHAIATAIVAALLTAFPAAHAQSVRGEPLRADAAKRAPTESFLAPTLAASATIRFQPLRAERIEALQRYNRESEGKRLRLGVDRDVVDEAIDLPETQPAGVRVAGGTVRRIDVESPGAAALRVGIDPLGLPDGAELRVSSASGGEVFKIDSAQMRAGVDGNGRFWTPVTAGDAQRVEVFVPGGGDAPALRVESVSHFVASPFDTLSMAKQLGASGTCNIDAVCRSATLGQPYVNAKNAVMLVVFQDGGPVSCTGTLLNDSTPSTQEPYVYSAAHCMTSQAIASTVETFWNYETPTCGTRSAGLNTQVTGGADLLFATLSSDALLLRLRRPPPAGAFFAGWNASTLAPGTAAIALHHPRADNKKYSRGSHSGFSANVSIDGQIVSSAARASWAEGTTEQGSSGSGLFVLNGADYQLRGGLAGGNASCANSNQSEAAGNVDFYSRFDQVYPSLRQWLGTAAGPTRDYTGAWFFPSEPGWGLTVFNYPNTFFALMFVYDTAGRPSWYRIQGDWTGTDSITDALERPSAPPWANSFNAGAITYANVGTATLTFTSATAASLTFSDGTVSRTVSLSKL